MMYPSSAGGSSTPEIDDREHSLSPSELLAHLDLHEGMTVADIESGAGYFALPLGRRVGPGGKVFAVDSPSRLELLRAGLRPQEVPANVQPVEGSAGRTTLRDASCDLVLMADLWHELEDREAALREARRIVREGGHLAILEWRHDAPAPPGPPAERRISPKATLCALEMNAWSLDEWIEIGPNGYLLLFEPTDESVQS